MHIDLQKTTKVCVLSVQCEKELEHVSARQEPLRVES